MKTSPVSIHPYFRAQSGKMEQIRELLPLFVDRTATEKANLYYEFTLSDDLIFCREAYVDAAAALTHLNNVGDLLDEMLKLSTLERLEIHGPSAELNQLREPLGKLNPVWFVCA